MKVLCNGLSLSEAVNKVIKAVSAHSNNPVLECIKIKTNLNSLVFIATDEEIYIEKKINADVMIEGEALVFGKYFADFVRTLSNENEVEFSLTPNNQLKIYYGGGVAEFACNSSLLFPEMEWTGEEQNFAIVKKEFKDLINKVSFSVASDDSRPVLRGVLLEIEDYLINAVALDGYRMAIARKALENNQASVNIILSARSLNEISKLLDDSEEIIRIYLKKNCVLVDLDNTKIAVRIMSGEFINYKHLIPKGLETEVIVNRQQFEKVLDRANLIARMDKNNMVKLSFINNELEISTKTDINKSNEKISVSIDGHDINIAFNSKYILDVLRATNDEFIKIKLKSETNPCIVQPVDDNDSYLYLILPVKM